MRKIFRTLSIILLCGALCAHALEAQSRGRNHGGEPQRTHVPSKNNGNKGTRPGNMGQGRPGSRPGNNGSHQQPGNNTRPNVRPGNNGSHQQPGNNTRPNVRPGNNGSHQQPGNNTRPNVRPGNNGSHQQPGNLPGNNTRPNVRPGNNGGHQQPGNRPGNNGHPNFRPGNNGHQPNYRPGGNNRPGNPGFRPGANHRPDYRPVGNPHPGGVRPWQGYRPGPVAGFGHIHYGRPLRPMLPPFRPYRRPAPPHHYVPYGGSLFGTILGLTVGTALNISLNSLVNNGYTVSAYGDDAIYLNNVNQLNLLWPSATLYYNNGYLNASQYVYSTTYYDMNRYNTAYRMLVNNYGVPVSSQQLSGGGIEASWWGNNGQYVTLQYLPQQAADGLLRYYTTLSFGM